MAKTHIWHGPMVYRVRDVVESQINNTPLYEEYGTIEEMQYQIEQQAKLISALVEILYSNDLITLAQMSELVGECREADAPKESV